MIPTINDLRINSPQCASLKPIEKVHQNPWFSVFNRGGYFTVEDNKPQSIVLPTVENNSLIMVRVRRPVINDDTLELPAGGLHEKESAKEAAIRELSEETGVIVTDSNRFYAQTPMVLSTRNPYLPSIFHIDITRQEFDSRSKHDHEILSVERFTFAEVLKKIENNEIYFGFHIAVITRFLIQNYHLEKLI